MVPGFVEVFVALMYALLAFFFSLNFGYRMGEGVKMKALKRLCGSRFWISECAVGCRHHRPHKSISHGPLLIPGDETCSCSMLLRSGALHSVSMLVPLLDA